MGVVTELQFRKIAPKAPATRWISPLNAAMAEFGITTWKRQAMFLAQTAHESQGFTRLEENLNYSAERLLEVFDAHFTPELASIYAHKPERIAARVYANRLGNGAQHTNEGWIYRGRGLIHLTGKANYRKAAEALGLDLVKHPDLLLSPIPAARSAAWFFSEMADGFRFADARDLEGCTHRINGGLNGIASRRDYYRRACTVLEIGIA